MASASACVTAPSAAAPKIVRVLSCPVLPNGALAITHQPSARIGSCAVPRDLIAVGDVMLDGALPAPVPGRRVHGRIELRAGGSAANAALAAVRLGATRRGRRPHRRGRRRAAGGGRRSRRPGWRCCSRATRLRRRAASSSLGGSAIVADPGASARLAPGGPAGAARGAAPSWSPATRSCRLGPKRLRGRRSSVRGPTWLAVDAASANLVTAFGVERFLDATATGRRPARERRGGVRADRARGRGSGARARPALPGRLRQARQRGRGRCVGGATARAAVRPIGGASTLGAGDSFAAGLLLALAGGAGLAAALQAGCDAAGAAIAGQAAGPTSRA